jgi:hypothetical protein
MLKLREADRQTRIACTVRGKKKKKKRTDQTACRSSDEAQERRDSPPLTDCSCLHLLSPTPRIPLVPVRLVQFVHRLLLGLILQPLLLERAMHSLIDPEQERVVVMPRLARDRQRLEEQVHQEAFARSGRTGEKEPLWRVEVFESFVRLERLDELRRFFLVAEREQPLAFLLLRLGQTFAKVGECGPLKRPCGKGGRFDDGV